MDLLWKDIRYSIHSLRVNPGFALIAILTLALCIGATTAIFSVINGVLLQPLPLHDPSRLVMVWEQELDDPSSEPNPVSPANYTDWLKQSKALFSSLAISFDWELSMTGQGEPEVMRVGLVNGALFPTLAATPFLGRTFEGVEAERAGGTAVLSYALWQRKFAGDRHAINRRIQLDGETYTVIGVMPREFLVPRSRADLWIPYEAPPTARGRYLKVMGRLAPGVTVKQAQAGMDVIARRLAVAYPANNTAWGVAVVPMHEEVVGSVRRALLIVFGAVALLLLIGCVNIANLLLSRATGRAKEMAVRAALGASRARLIRQLLTETLVLAVISGIAGVLIAGWATMLLVRFTPESAMLPRMAEIAVDGRVLAVSVLLTLVTAVLFGVIPAIEASRTDLQTGLKSMSRGSSQDRRGKAFRNTLVVAEVALATVLLIGAGLLIRSFAKLEGVNLGVKSENALTMRVVLPAAQQQGERRIAMLTQILEQAAHVPGVETAAAIVSVNMPFTDSWSNTDFRIEGGPPAVPGDEPSADIRPIAGEYFRAMGEPMLQGRPLDDRAVAPANTEFVVNQAFVRRYFPDGKALGRRIFLEWHADLHGTIVGVAGDVRVRGPVIDPPPAIYLSYAHDENPQFSLILRTSADPQTLQAPVTTVLRKMDPLMPVDDVKTLSDMVAGTISRPRFNATMLSLFAALGLLLASIGIYGVLSYAVSQRRREIGIRLALGAQPREIQRLFLRRGLVVVGLGVAIGLGGAAGFTRLMQSLLFGISPLDPITFTAMPIVLAAAAVLASYLPARRAAAIDPVETLRAD
jgi:predicted permease